MIFLTFFLSSDGELKTYIKCDSCQRLIWVKSFNLIDISPFEAASTENGTNCEIESSILKNGTNSEKESSSSIENLTNNEKESFSSTESSINIGKKSNKRGSEIVTSSERPHKKFRLVSMLPNFNLFTF